MHLQVLSSGSAGNATLVRAGELHVLIDAGLPVEELVERLERARVAPQRIDHVALTHGHLDHARGAGAFARRFGARVWCTERMMMNRSVRRSRRLSTLTLGKRVTLEPEGVEPPPQTKPEGLGLTPVPIPHDAHPTVAYRLEHGGRCAVLLTDMGHPEPRLAVTLGGAHLLLLEFNHDAGMLREGPYKPALKRRVGGDQGHLSNAQAQEVLGHLRGPELHTLVLAHLSRVNNTPELALDAARGVVGDAVRLVVADQEEVGPNLAV